MSTAGSAYSGAASTTGSSAPTESGSNTQPPASPSVPARPAPTRAADELAGRLGAMNLAPAASLQQQQQQQQQPQPGQYYEADPIRAQYLQQPYLQQQQQQQQQQHQAYLQQQQQPLRPPSPADCGGMVVLGGQPVGIGAPEMRSPEPPPATYGAPLYRDPPYTAEDFGYRPRGQQQQQQQQQPQQQPKQQQFRGQYPY
ncbi:hypothetical protein PAPYR_4359 [Paratrimastix pyriformis]|uniref:Uncharacterized protein n=1 Tax=Paratrimastix pyriformis TaxID=342808 RepID=A0ABQ8UK79_9EUKA|nr:hypothetical protein PAPYR_4359 [Paratrimastix pyriformis]